MPHSNSTGYERRIPLHKFPLWVSIFGLTFAMGSLIAEDDDIATELDTVVEADEEEKTESDVTTDEKEIVSDSSNQDETTASNDSHDEESSLKQLIAKEREAKSDQDETDDDAKSKVQLSSHLPNEDPSANVIIVTGEGISELFEQIEKRNELQKEKTPLDESPFLGEDKPI